LFWSRAIEHHKISLKNNGVNNHEKLLKKLQLWWEKKSIHHGLSSRASVLPLQSRITEKFSTITMRGRKKGSESGKKSSMTN
jgi:hypothetical protein